ncbi:SPOR domain-containing protein [Thiomicrorhabdus aquaedulcis]|uniref:SPOR domain-containing protein n=1 Tax=Thiomicrorhabdus aquaedulcis TaxID=2211106 RepID=UPI000FD9D27C|nr:SPOR domain-containing protein [Thiomicrorhabdus aquaedulcis]
MDEVSKYRLMGATIWLGLLVLIVPTWYSNPVNFSPVGHQQEVEQSTRPIVDQAYTLSPKDQNIEEPQLNKIVESTISATTNAVDKGLQTTPNNTDSAQAPPSLSAKSQWIVRVSSYPSSVQAKALEAELKANYKVAIKYFEKSKVYSVRTGPYDSKNKAEADRIKLDKLLGTKSQVVEFR